MSQVCLLSVGLRSGTSTHLRLRPAADRIGRPPPSFRTFIYNRPNPPGLANVGSHKSVQNEGTITLLEEQTVLQAGTTGLRTWSALGVIVVLSARETEDLRVIGSCRADEAFKTGQQHST